MSLSCCSIIVKQLTHHITPSYDVRTLIALLSIFLDFRGTLANSSHNSTELNGQQMISAPSGVKLICINLCPSGVKWLNNHL